MIIKGQAQTTLESMGWKFNIDSYMAQNNNTMLEKRVEWQDNGSICFYVVSKNGEHTTYEPEYISYYELELFYRFLTEVLENEK